VLPLLNKVDLFTIYLFKGLQMKMQQDEWYLKRATVIKACSWLHQIA